MVKTVIAVFIGSGLGGVCRYLLSGLVDRLTDSAPGYAAIFPWGTFAVNIIGCFIIGLVYGLIANRVEMSPGTKLLLTTGFCGGLTTFSTFSHENLILFQGGNMPVLLIYAAASLLTGIAAAWLGHAVA